MTNDISQERDRWGSDVPISAPLPNDEAMGIDHISLGGGFAFGPMGHFLPVSTTTYEERYSPVWGPRRSGVAERRDDGKG